MSRLSIEDIKREAQARIFDVLGKLGVSGRSTQSGYISMCNPVMKDRHPSFTIWVRDPAAGAWKDHRDDTTKGDVIDLVSYLSGWWSLPKKGRAEALRWLVAELGLERIDSARLAEDRAKARRRHLEHSKAREEELADKRARAFTLWLEAAKIPGTPVENYLRGRGIDLADLPVGPRGGDHRPSIIRCLRSHRHTETGTEWPVMIAGCVDQAGEIQAVHRTWLRPHGEGKAPIDPQKKVWPGFAGLVIPLWRGASFLPVAKANADAEEHGVFEPLVLTEGIEDGLTAAIAAPKYRTWAFISLSNLVNVVLPKCIDGVILHRQREWENRTAVAAWERGRAALERQGRMVVEGKALRGKDWNDWQTVK